MSSTFDPDVSYNTITSEDWKQEAIKALRGKEWDTLEKTSSDGIEIHPLYYDLPQTAPIAPKPQDFKGFWDIRQIVRVDNAENANKIALQDLENGVNSIEFECFDDNINFEQLLKDIAYEYATIGINSYEHCLIIAQRLVDFIPDDKKETALLSFNIGPVSLKMSGYDIDIDAAYGFYTKYAPIFKNSIFFTSDAKQILEMGGSRALQVAFSIANGIQGLRFAESKGIDLNNFIKSSIVKIGINQESVAEIGKIRAIRLLWAKIADKAGVTAPLSIHAYTSKDMMTETDPYSNVLRNSIAVFAASTGGANIITTLPHELDEEKENEFSRRLARNTQIVLANESSLAKVNDPAGGSYAIENITNIIARDAWAIVQEIEKAGGLLAAINSGLIAEKLAEKGE